MAVLNIRRRNGSMVHALPPNCGVVNLFIGDSNSIGWDSSINAAIAELNTWPTTVVAGTTPYSVVRNNVFSNWDQTSVSSSLDPATGRNDGEPAGTGTIVLSADLGHDTGVVADLMVSPEWSLSADLTSGFYQSNSEADVYTAGNAYFFQWIKMGQTGATFCDGGGSAGSWSPSAGTSILFANLLENISGQRDYIAAAAAGSLTTYLDTVYLNLGSADASGASGFENGIDGLVGNMREFLNQIGLAFGLGGYRELNVIGTDPIGGAAYGYERTAALREEWRKATGPFNLRTVRTDDLERDGDDHFTARGIVEMGRRMARERASASNFVIRELANP